MQQRRPKMRTENCQLDLAMQMPLGTSSRAPGVEWCEGSQELQEWLGEKTEGEEEVRVYRAHSEDVWMKKKKHNGKYPRKCWVFKLRTFGHVYRLRKESKREGSEELEVGKQSV